MKSRTLIIGLFSAATFAVVVGCKQEAEQTSQPAEATRDASAQLEKMKQKTGEAMEATADYAYAQKKEFAAKIRSELVELNREIDQLSAKVAASSASAKAEAATKLEAVRAKAGELGKKLDGVQDATESTWNDVKAGLKSGYDDVKESVKQARQWISDKIAP